MKSGFWQIQFHEHDKYKIAFIVPFGHYEQNVMHFGLKNVHLEFQNIMNDIFNHVLIFSNSIEHHFKHLEILQKIVRENVWSCPPLRLSYFKLGLYFQDLKSTRIRLNPFKGQQSFLANFQMKSKIKLNFKGSQEVLTMCQASTQTLEPS